MKKMKKAMLGVLSIVAMGALLLAAPVSQDRSCPGGCCTGPDDCPQPECCR